METQLPKRKNNPYMLGNLTFKYGKIKNIDLKKNINSL
jgi:hypothetical protein